MFKRTSHIVLSFILLVSTIGLVVSKHYCDTELVSISFFDISDSCCDDNSCCHDESEVFQLKVDFAQNTGQVKVTDGGATNLLILVSRTVAEFLISDNEQSFEHFLDKHPPLLSPKLFSFNQAYLL